MTYPNNFEEKVGFNKIRELLSESCLCSLGIERVTQMHFDDRLGVIQRQLSETDEMLRILPLGDFPDSHFYDVRLALKRIRIENTFLETEELLQLCRSLHVIEQIHSYLLRTENDVYLYPRMAKGLRTLKFFLLLY